MKYDGVNNRWLPLTPKIAVLANQEIELSTFIKKFK